jgi:PAP2 superfamily
VERFDAEPRGSRAAALGRRLLRRRDGRATLWIEALVIAWLLWLYDVINDFAPTRIALAHRDALGLLSFERSLHIDPELTLNRWLSGQSVLAFIGTYYYFFAHVLVTVAVLVLLWWRAPHAYRRARSQLVVINLIAFVVFWRYPLAPPRMLTGFGFTDVVASTHAVISWHSAALVHDADQYAAMPSLHIAWASWSAISLWQLSTRRWVRALGPVHIALTALFVMATGNHYLLDVLAGGATAAIGVVLVAGGARALARWWRPVVHAPPVRPQVADAQAARTEAS